MTFHKPQPALRTRPGPGRVGTFLRFVRSVAPRPKLIITVEDALPALSVTYEDALPAVVVTAQSLTPRTLTVERGGSKLS